MATQEHVSSAIEHAAALLAGNVSDVSHFVRVRTELMEKIGEHGMPAIRSAIAEGNLIATVVILASAMIDMGEPDTVALDFATKAASANRLPKHDVPANQLEGK